MKYHLNNNGKALCGAVPSRPDTWLFDPEGFNKHHAKGFQCQRCKRMINRDLGRRYLNLINRDSEEGG